MGWLFDPSVAAAVSSLLRVVCFACHCECLQRHSCATWLLHLWILIRQSLCLIHFTGCSPASVQRWHVSPILVQLVFVVNVRPFSGSSLLIAAHQTLARRVTQTKHQQCLGAVMNHWHLCMLRWQLLWLQRHWCCLHDPFLTNQCACSIETSTHGEIYLPIYLSRCRPHET